MGNSLFVVELIFYLAPIRRNDTTTARIVAPVSTVLYVPKAHADSLSPSEYIPTESNIPKDKHWTECSAPGTVVLIQQPQGQICALVGDIIATRLKLRGISGLVAAGRIRDVASCAEICRDGEFHMWSQGFSAAAPSLETKPWLLDVPLQLGQVCVKPGDIICADEGDMTIVVIPREQLEQVFALLPTLKEASDAVLAEVENGMPLFEATKRHPEFYSNHK
jgi:regulator of RNase E activity RraA